MLGLGQGRCARQITRPRRCAPEVRRKASILLPQLEAGCARRRLGFQPQYWPGYGLVEQCGDKLILVQLASKPDALRVYRLGRVFASSTTPPSARTVRVLGEFKPGDAGVRTFGKRRCWLNLPQPRVVQSYLGRGRDASACPRSRNSASRPTLVYSRARDSAVVANRL